jgi:hypothetical protein
MLAMLAGLAVLDAGGQARASCEGRLLCTEFKDPPTRQEVVVAPVRARTAGTERIRTAVAEPRQRVRRRTPSRTHAAVHRKSRQERYKDAPARIAATPPASSRTSKAQPEPAVRDTAVPDPALAEVRDAVVPPTPPSAKFVVEDGFNVIAAESSDDPEQQALFALRYLANRAETVTSQTAVAAAAPTPTPAGAGRDEPAARPEAAAAVGAPHHSMLIDLAAALAGVIAIAAALTVLAGRPMRMRRRFAYERWQYDIVPTRSIRGRIRDAWWSARAAVGLASATRAAASVPGRLPHWRDARPDVSRASSARSFARSRSGL